MEYRITKDCKTGWDDTGGTTAWGVSENQHGRAQKVEQGDILLHYIDNAHAWAGYSMVSGPLQKNRRDSHADWLAALPCTIPIERGVWLTKDQCEHTTAVHGLPEKHYHRQVAFTRVPPNEAELIIKAIENAATLKSKASDPFNKCWKVGAENYYKRIVKSKAGGKCLLCGEDIASWANRVTRAGLLPGEIDKIHDGFLDAAHIIAVCDDGSMMADNLKPLCPTCHRVVDKLTNERRKELLTSIGNC